MATNVSNTTNLLQNMTYPCKGTFRNSGDLISQMLANSTTFAWQSTPLARLLLLVDHDLSSSSSSSSASTTATTTTTTTTNLNLTSTTFRNTLAIYALVFLITLLISIIARIVLARSGLQSTVAFVLERGNRCGTNLAVRRRKTFACFVRFIFFFLTC